MSVGPDIPALAARFEFAGAVREATPLTAGHINDSFRIVCAAPGHVERVYFLQRLNTAIFTRPKLVMENIARVTSHLRAKLEAAGQADVDRRVLRLVPAQDGALWIEDDEGDVWRAYDFISGTRMQTTVRCPAEAATAGAAFGEFQALLADLPGPPLHESLPGFHDTPQRYETFDEALAADAFNRAAGATAEIEAVLARRESASRLMDLLTAGQLPQRVVHNDAKLSNVMLDETTGEALAVVDLDLVMQGTGLFDYGDMLRSLTTDADEDEPDPSNVVLRLDLFEALTRGYLRHARSFLSETEVANLVWSGRIITLEQAVRFLGDYLAGDRYYKTDRPNQNLERARTQVKLLAEMEAREPEMHRLIDEILAEESEP